MIPDNHQIKVRKIAKAMNISKKHICHIVNQDLGMRKLTAH